jgi:glycerophosphoryl diester phosphodiesterase
MTLVYGHRGARGEAPENTIAGFLHAKAEGVAGIETDIALTADHIPVIHHNPELADGRLIRDVKRSFMPEIPSLAEALAAVPDMDWLLEVKTFPPTPEKSFSAAIMAAAIIAVLRASGIPASRLYILAFEWQVLREFAAHAPEFPRVCLTAPPQEEDRAPWWGRGYEGLTTPQAVARCGAGTWSPLHKTLAPAQIIQAHELGLKIIPWTVNDPADFARLSPLVDGLTTDYPSRFCIKQPKRL